MTEIRKRIIGALDIANAKSNMTPTVEITKREELWIIEVDTSPKYRGVMFALTDSQLLALKEALSNIEIK